MRQQPQHTGRTLICQIRVRPHVPLIHASSSSAYEIFCSLFPDELLALLVEETNRYYDQTVAALGGLDNIPSTSRLWDWMPIDLSCMKAFLAILIQMGVDQRNLYELYWTTIELIALANFKKIMPYNRFVIILRCLHVCDNTKIDGMDKLAKIRSMLNILAAAWQAAYYPNWEICLDESMIDSRAGPVRWFINPKSLLNGGYRRGSWPIQEPHIAVNKLFNCRQSLIQSNSNKPSLQKRP